MSSDNANVNLFWTGGWDSTFQLLQLLLVHRLRVTPFYLIDEERSSSGVEIQTMHRIKNYLFSKYPHTRELLFPMRYFGVSDISPDPPIEEAFEAILADSFMGGQYNWLARFCKQNSVQNMHLCIHQGGNVDRVIQDFVRPVSEGPLTVYRIDSRFEMNNEYKVFRYFSLPIFELDKVRMGTIAREKGWEEVMRLTWFCHRPRRGLRGLRPCGICNPCIYAIEQGLAWRMPCSSRMASLFYRCFIRPYDRLILDTPLLKAIAKRLLK